MAIKFILPNRLLDSWDSSARTHRSLTIFYLAALGFVWIVVEGTTHEQLLNPEISIALPVIGSAIPVLSFYIAAPIFLLFLHTQLLLQAVQLSNSFTSFAQRSPFKVTIEGINKKEDWRNIVLPTLLTSVLLRPPDLNRYAYFLMRGIAFISYWCLVPLVLIRLQLKFLPYHDKLITFLHQVSVSTSLILITIFYVAIRSLKDKNFIFFKFLERKSKLLQLKPKLILILVKLKRDIWKYLLKKPKFYFFSSVYLLILIFCWTALSIPQTPKENGACLPIPFNILVKPFINDSSASNECSKIGDFIVRNLNLPGKQLTLEPSPEFLTRFQGQENKKKLLEHYGILDLTNRNLSFANFKESDLTKADFRGTKLNYGNFENAILDNSIWKPYKNLDASPKITSAKGLNISHTNMQDADLSNVNMQDADLSSANLQNADLSNANLQRAEMTDINLQGADLSNANLHSAYMYRANLQGTNIYGTNLKQADMTATILKFANITNAILEDASLNEANLVGASLNGASLISTDITGATLLATDLSNANLQDADLSSAILLFTDLSNATFQNTKLDIDKLYGNTIKICHNGQKLFKETNINSPPQEKCIKYRRKTIEILKNQ
jgi:uncharacterized protein YjbI with pentapeptide repeats